MRHRVSRREVACVLRAAVREDDWDRPRPALAAIVRDRDLAPLLAATAHHRVASFVHLALRGLDGLDPAAAAALERTYRAGIEHHLRALGDLAGFGRCMAAAGIPWVTLKGPVLAETVYTRPDLRLYSDLDVLVPRASFPAAIDALRAGGAELLDRNWDLILREERGQLHVRLRNGTVADVHWHVVNRGHTRSSALVPVGDLVERARPVPIAGGFVPTLERVDSLLHLCLHAGMDGGGRLLSLKDIERTISSSPPDWDELAVRAYTWRINILVGAVLQRARRVVGADVPDPVLHLLLPSRGWRAVTVTVDRRWPVERLDRPAAAPMLFTRALRGGAAGSLAAAADHVRGQARLRAVRRATPGPAGSPGALPILHASAASGAQEEFLRRVSS